MSRRGRLHVALLCVATDPSRGLLSATATSLRAQGVSNELITVDDMASTATVVDSDADWIGFIDPGDVLEPDALSALVGDAAEVDLSYSDEDVIDHRGSAVDPWFKPDWSLDRLRCQPYTSRLTLFRTSVLAAHGGVPSGLGPAAEFDMVLRVGEHARGVRHVRRLLYHRASPHSRPYPAHPVNALVAATRSVDAHLDRSSVMARAEAHPTMPGLLRLRPHLTRHPLVSIVIPTGATVRSVRGTPTCLVVHCVRTLLERSTYQELEVVCVVDRAVDDRVRAELRALDAARVRLVDFDGPFHFARKVNLGAISARGAVLVLLNDDTEVISPGWIEAMLIHGLDPGVGAVGARLLFEDGRIQHAGVVAVRGNPGHPYYEEPGDIPGYLANAAVPINALAVTGACLMTRRECFDAVGGLSPWFPSNYNDLDYCLKVGRAGYRVACTPDAELFHFESSSRDGSVADQELELIRRRWGRLLRDDPFYGPNFPSGNADYVPADPATVT